MANRAVLGDSVGGNYFFSSCRNAADIFINSRRMARRRINIF
jgi:hypothetical protein